MNKWEPKQLIQPPYESKMVTKQRSFAALQHTFHQMSDHRNMLRGLVQQRASEPRGMFLTLKVGFVLSGGEVRFLPSVAIQLPSNQGHCLWMLALKTELINAVFRMISLMVITHLNIPKDSFLDERR